MTILFAHAPSTVAPRKAKSTSPLRSLLAGLILAGALLGFASQVAPTAHADAEIGSNGGDFLGALASKGISFKSAQAVIATGHQVCAELDQGKQAGDVANEVMAQTNLDGYHAGYFIGASIGAICPRHGH